MKRYLNANQRWQARAFVQMGVDAALTSKDVGEFEDPALLHYSKISDAMATFGWPEEQRYTAERCFNRGWDFTKGREGN